MDFTQFNKGDKVVFQLEGKFREGVVVKVLDNYYCEVKVKGFTEGKVVHKSLLSKFTGKDKQGASNYNPYQMVKDFHLAFKHPAPESPVVMSYDVAYNRSKWVIEEVIEHLHATDHINLANNKQKILDDISDMIDKEIAKQEIPASYEECLIAQTDALIDQLYFVYGSLVVQGVRPEKLFEIVNSFNLDKLNPDGSIVYKDKEKKKIGKREGWIPPDEEIKKEILRQVKEAEGNGE